jgi:tether containing UBX domain for GLUT4
MASHVVVTDTSFRRQTVKATPGIYMTDVLNEACKKFGVKASNYTLKLVFDIFLFYNSV